MNTPANILINAYAKYTCDFTAKSENGISLKVSKKIAVDDDFLSFRGEPIEVTCEIDGAPEMLLEWSCKKSELKSGHVESCKNLPGFNISHVRIL